MAKAERINEPVYRLELTEGEARTLATLLGNKIVGPEKDDDPRAHTSAIWHALDDLGVESDRTIRFSISENGNLRMER